MQTVGEDIVFINELRVETTIGIYDWEKKIKQAVYFTIEMPCDCARAAATESIEDTVDYKAVSKRIIEYVSGNRFELVETLAHRVCELLIAEFGLGWVRLTANKRGAVRHATDIGVRIERRAAND